MRKPIIAGNWKMYKNLDEIETTIQKKNEIDQVIIFTYDFTNCSPIVLIFYY